MLKELRSFDADRCDIDQLVALSAFAKVLHAEYEARNINVPEWLDDSRRTLAREIEGRRRDALELRLKEVRAQKSGLMTASEQREALAAEEAALTSELAATK